MRCLWFKLLLSLLLVVGTSVVWAEETSDDTALPEIKDSEKTLKLRGGDEEGTSYDWYLFAGDMFSFPRLDNASKQIDRQINRTFRMIAPHFKDVKTFADQRDTLMIQTPFLGLVRVLNDNLDVFVQAGYTAGSVRTRAENWSLLILPLHTDVKFERSNFFIGLGSHWHPWGSAELKAYDSWGERFRGSKIFFAGSVNYNYLTFDADVRAGLGPFGKPLRIQQSDIWRLWNVSTLVGVDVPYNERTMFCFNVNYNTFLDHGADFSGFASSIYLKWFF